MTRIITVVSFAVLATGCVSTQHSTTPDEQHQAAKTQYYDTLNRAAFAAVDADLEHAPGKESDRR
jgi:type II secretory pathway component PulJ